MGNIQTMMAIGAIVLFSFASVNFNSAVLSNLTLEVENKVYLTAFSLADDLIEEIKQKAFDERTIDFQAIAVNQLTPPTSLNPDAGEVYPYFDDIDDYNGYEVNVSLPHSEGYKVTSSVFYVNSEGQNVSTQTFYKKVLVKVESRYLRSPLFLSFIFSLHSKN